MPITQTIAAAPEPLPNRAGQTQTQFNQAADGLFAWLADLPTQTNAWSGQANALAGELDSARTAALAAIASDRGGALSAIASDRSAALSAIVDAEGVATANVETLVADAEAARDAALQNANFAGLWSAQSGAASPPYAVAHQGRVWGLLTSLANVAASEPNAANADWLDLSPPDTRHLAYADRAQARADTTSRGLLIESLGYFVHVVDATEPDDDESCFVTSTGCWLLEAAHWDLIDAWQLPTALSETLLTAPAAFAIESLAATSQVSFKVSVPGANTNDAVSVTPPNALTAHISLYAAVTAPNTVTVYLNNPSAATAALTTGTGRITVIKEL